MTLATGFVLGLLLTACGDDGSGGDTDGATSATSTGGSGSTGGPDTNPTGPEPGTSSTTDSGPTTTGDPSTTTVDPDGSSSSSDTGAGASASAVIMGLADYDGEGTAAFTEQGGEVTLVIELSNVLPQGLHGIHIHEVGDCSAIDGSSAGGHWNPYGAMHGMLGMGESHLGDLGNIDIDAAGSGTLMITTPEWTIGTGDDTDVVGRAIILHEGEDDLSPAPDPGARIGCGEVVLDPA